MPGRLLEPITAVRLAEDLTRAGAAGEIAVLEDNTSDILVTPDGKSLRLPRFVAQVHAEAGRAPVLYSSGRSAQRLSPPGHEPASVRLPARDAHPHVAVAALLQAAGTSPDPIALILDFAERLIPSLPPGAIPSPELSSVLEAIQHVPADPVFEARGHALVLIARSGGLHRGLLESPGVRVIRVPRPGEDDRALFLRLLSSRADEYGDRFAALAEGVTIEDVARETGGMRNDDLARAAREAADAGEPLTLDRLRPRKASALERQAGDVLRLYPEGLTMRDLAGQPHLHRYVSERQRSGEFPTVLLLLGPPGVGKSFAVRCIAESLGRPVVALHNYRSPWVGETESNIHRALDLISDARPIVVHVDEADQVIGRRSTAGSSDAGTHERTLATLWNHTGEPRRGELWIFTSNRGDLLEGPIHDRADVIPLLHPTATEVEQLLPVLAAQLDRALADDLDPAQVARLPKLRITSGRALLAILRRASTLADLASSRPHSVIQHAHLIEAVADYLPDPDHVEEEYVGLQAIFYTKSRNCLPWTAYDNGRPEMPSYLEPLIDANGELDRDSLRARMRELEAELAARRARKEW